MKDKIKVREVNGEPEEVIRDNEEHTEIMSGLNELIELSKKQVVKVGKDENEVIDPQVVFSPKISYGLIKNVGRTKKIEKLRKSVIEKITSEFNDRFPEDEEKFAIDLNYRIIRKYKLEKFISGHAEFKEFLKDTKEQIGYFIIDLTEKGKSEIDPDGVFDVAKIPPALLDVVFKVE